MAGRYIFSRCEQTYRLTHVGSDHTGESWQGRAGPRRVVAGRQLPRFGESFDRLVASGGLKFHQRDAHRRGQGQHHPPQRADALKRVDRQPMTDALAALMPEPDEAQQLWVRQ